MRKIVVIPIMLAVIASIYLFLNNAQSGLNISKEQQEKKPDEKENEISLTGNVFKSGQSQWFLSYKSNGSATTSVEIEFNSKSICQVDSIFENCEQFEFDSQKQTSISGIYLNDNLILIQNLNSKSADPQKQDEIRFSPEALSQP
jgi:hypothetical protein